MSVAMRLARFVAELEPAVIPAVVLEKAQQCLFWGYGIALGSCRVPYARLAAQASIELHGVVSSGGATLLASGERTSVAGAAFGNSALFHARSQEDTCGASHFGAVVIPVLTALLESGRYDPAGFMPALVAGYEVGAAVQAVCGVQTAAGGHRGSSLYGPIAAAAAAGRLMRLPVDELANAIAAAVSYSGGPMQSLVDGSDEWRYQLGFAAEQGLMAAELARRGSRASCSAFEGPAGFARVYARMDCDIAAFSGLGREWAMRRVAFKPFPACGAAQIPALLSLRLREERNVERISAIKIALSPPAAAYPGVSAQGPFATRSAAQTSIPFCVAAVLIQGKLDLASFGGDDPRVLDLARRVTLVADPELGLYDVTLEVSGDDGPPSARKYRRTPDEPPPDRKRLTELVIRAGRDEGVPPSAYDALWTTVSALPSSRPSDLLGCFKARWGDS